MTATEVLQYLQKEIHSTVAATVDDDGLPATCAIDVMDADENGLYFLTARGKGFYSRLKRRGLSAGVHRFFRRAGGHTAGKLPALRELPCGLPAERGHSGGILMTQTERRLYLIEALLAEQPQYAGTAIPADTQAQKQLLRALFNVRPPRPAGAEFLAVQDDYLQEETRRKGITDFSALRPVQDGLYLWQGDITTLRCDAIVNAANSRMLGCFVPCHGCIDNAIHTWAGVQLRLACAELMKQQGCDEETGRAKITPAFNLPCRYVLHTVGPIVGGRLTALEEAQLADCYRACLTLAAQNGVQSIAFCCISTGEFRFPNERAAEIAVETVRDWRQRSSSRMAVIFNVFKEKDLHIYRKRLGTA